MAVDELSRFLEKNQDEEDELQAKNRQIFHYSQNLLTNTSLLKSSLSILDSILMYLYQVLICGTYVLFQLCQFCKLL